MLEVKRKKEKKKKCKIALNKAKAHEDKCKYTISYTTKALIKRGNIKYKLEQDGY